MKTTKPTVVAALASLYTRDPHSMEQMFQHLKPPNLATLDKQLFQLCCNGSNDSNDNNNDTKEACHQVIAQAVIRRVVHKCLHKYSNIYPPDEVEAALKFHTLPEQLQLELQENNDGKKPQTWYEAVEQLKQSSSSTSELWTRILEHPMTSYVPVQCQACGHIIPDETHPTQSDAEIGLVEMDPREGDEILDIRTGWFRGPRTKAKVFQLTCPQCKQISYWYRSGHPQIMLNPNRWGRLCGEQEDLRLNLASYLGIPVRTCLPLDWDHIWSEYQEKTTGLLWTVQDDSARNFAVRLDEGIGCWTRVWAIHPDPSLCADVSEEYLTCRHDGDDSFGRADPNHASQMDRYRTLVEEARTDPTAACTQAKSLNGYVLYRAKLNCSEITKEMQKAAQDFGSLEWWQIE